MLILTNYNNEYEKLLKKLKDNLRKSKSKQNKNRILNECLKEIEKWHFHLMIKCFIISVLLLICFISCHFLLNFNEIWIPIMVFFYIFCFALDKYHNQDNMKTEIKEYASEILFVSMDDIIIR